MQISPYFGSTFAYAEVERVVDQKNIDQIQTRGEEVMVTVHQTGMDLDDETLKPEGSASLPRYGDGPALSIAQVMGVLGPVIAAMASSNQTVQIVDGFMVDMVPLSSVNQSL